MLEKSRVTSQQSGERNFHVLHTLLDGAPDEIAARLFLEEDPAPASRLGYRPTSEEEKGGGRRDDNEDDGDIFSWRLLTAGQTSQDEMYDASKHDSLIQGAPDAYRSTISALKGLSVSPPLLKGLWATLAAILHLGQVTYVDKASGGDGYSGGNMGCDPEDSMSVGGEDGGSVYGDVSITKGHLAHAATLLGVDGLSLHKALSEHVLGTMGRRTSIQVMHLDKQKTASNRDALIRMLYAKIFAWVVRVSNRAIAGQEMALSSSSNSGTQAVLSPGAQRAAKKAADALRKAQRSLSVLDIYGFEILDVCFFHFSNVLYSPHSFHFFYFLSESLCDVKLSNHAPNILEQGEKPRVT
jgi:myosin heavy subunit